MSTSQNSDRNTQTTNGRIAIRPKTVAFVLLGFATIGLAVWGLSSDSPTTEDLVSDDEWVNGMKSPLGAVGVSDSAAGPMSESAPLVLPHVTPDGLATAGNAGRSTELTGPLFNESISNSPSSRQGITTAGFERPVSSPTSGSARPITEAPRVTANQPVWLTGTIEASPTQGRAASK